MPYLPGELKKDSASIMLLHIRLSWAKNPLQKTKLFECNSKRNYILAFYACLDDYFWP
jgi:hypothetical protein